jgi:hypothetical protein
MPVSFQRCNRVVATVSASLDGEFKWSGDTPTANIATEIMHEKGWTRGRFLNDELFLVRRVVKVLGDCEVEVVDAELIVKSLREGWIQLLRDNLLPDPAAHLGRGLDDLTRWNGSVCQIEARGATLSTADGRAHTRRWPVNGVVSVGDPQFLRFTSRIGTTVQRVRFPIRAVMWERIVCVHFSHSTPPPEIMIESRDTIRKRLAERSLRQLAV